MPGLGKTAIRKRKSAKKGNNGPPAKKSASTAKKSTPKKPTPQKPAAAAPQKPAAAAPQKPAAEATKPLRSATLKEQLEKQKQETLEWKKKAFEYEFGLRHKAHQAQSLLVQSLTPKGEDDNVCVMLKKGLVKDV